MNDYPSGHYDPKNDKKVYLLIMGDYWLIMSGHYG